MIFSLCLDPDEDGQFVPHRHSYSLLCCFGMGEGGGCRQRPFVTGE